jgi:hypothetical protein
MNTKISSCALFILILLACQVWSQEPGPAPVLPSFQRFTPEQDKQTDKDKKQPDKDKKQSDKDKIKEPEKKAVLGAPQTDVFAPVANDLGQVLPGFTPNMMGWVPPIYFANRPLPVTGLQATTVTGIPIAVMGRQTTATVVALTPLTQPRTLLVPIATRGPFAIAENESPAPQDRVYFANNYYGDVRGPQSGPNSPFVASTTSTTTVVTGRNNVATVTTTTNAVLPGAPSVNVNRETFGFEKTFLDGNASVEVRLPFLQQPSTFDGFGSDCIGDLTIIGKYAFYLDRSTGNVISGGLAVTAPTGPAIATTQGNLRDTLLQPFVGYLWNFDRVFVQAFHSVVVPTDASDVTILFNDVGFGYRLYQGDPNRFLSSIAPALEVHVATPLNHRGAVNDPLLVPDIAAVTAGVHFGIFRNATLSVGVTTPVTAPRVYNVEGFVQMNWRF